LVTTHIGPRFGHEALGEIHNSDISQWSAELHACGYQHSTVLGVISLLGRILGDAAEDGLIPATPIHHGVTARRCPTSREKMGSRGVNIGTAEPAPIRESQRE